MMPSVETAAVVKSLLGDLIDAEAFTKMGPDPSSVHVNGNLRAVRIKRKVTKRGEQNLEQEPSALKRNVALATNAGGVLAAPGAIYAANQARKAKEGGVPRAAMKSKAGRKTGLHRVASAIERNPRAVAAAGAAGVGLQVLNASGDYIAAQEMNRQRKVANARAARVDKSFRLNQIRAGRMRSMMTTLGVGGKRGGQQSLARGTSTRAGGAQHRPGPPAGTYVNPNPTPATPGVPRGDIGSNAPGPLTPAQQQAASRGAAARGGVEDFVRSTPGKVSLGIGGLGAAYYTGKGKGREQAYYGKRDEVEIAGTFSKFDDEKKRAYGWASVVTMNGEPVVDRQGDYIGLDDIEEAAYTYVRKSRVAGDMHRRTTGLDGADAPHKAGELIESVVFTPDKCQAMGLPASFAGKWWMGVQIEDDDVWQEVKKGNRTGFSIHGKGLRKDTSLDDIRAGR